MKKRRILVSLALASAALFSLAACGKTESTPTPTPAPTSAPAPATSTAPAASSTPAAASSSQAADKVTVKYIAKYSDGAADEELTALATQIDKNTKATAPAENPTKDGYVFKGFRNKTTHLPFDFDANITKNTDIVAYFYKPGTYDEIAASDDAVMAYDFDDAELGAKIPAYDADLTGLCNSKDVDDESYGATVVVKDYHNMLKTYDLGDKQTKVLFNIKDAIENSKVTIYAKFKLDGTMGSSWPFIEVLTKDGTEEKAAYGFGGDGNKKLGYRIGDGGYQNYKDELLEADKEYNALFEVDTDAKTIKLTLNGEAFNPVSADFDNVTGIRFVTGGSAGSYTGHSDERFIIIDQFAVKAEANDIAAVKTGAKASVKAVYDAYVESDKADELETGAWDDVAAAYNAAYTETTGTIDTATDAAGVKTARDAAIDAIEDAIDDLRDAKALELTGLLAHKGTAGCWYWTGTSLDNYNLGTTDEKTAYDTALDALKDTYLAQLGSINNVKEGYELLADFVADANNIVKEKVDVTVKYYKYQYTEATGITEFAEGTTYYTEASGVYTKVADDAAFDNTKKYYTYSPVSAGTDATFKNVKDEAINLENVPSLTGFVNLGSYSDATLSTLFAPTTVITDSNTIVYERVASKIELNYSGITTFNRGELYQDIFTFYGKDIAETDTSNKDYAKRNVTAGASSGVQLTGGKAVAKNGTSGLPANCVKVVCEKDGVISLTATSSKNGTDYKDTTMKIVLYTVNADGSSQTAAYTADTAMAPKGDTPSTHSFNVKAGTYYIGSADSGCILFSLSYTVDSTK